MSTSRRAARKTVRRAQAGTCRRADERQRLELVEQVEQRWVLDRDVGRVLVQDPAQRFALVVAQDDDPRVVEVPRQFVLDVPDRPLLQHVTQGVAVRDGNACRAARQSPQPGQIAVVMLRRARLAQPGHRYRGGPAGPVADERARLVDPSVRPEPEDADGMAEKHDVLVVVAVHVQQADFDDQGGLGRRHRVGFGRHALIVDRAAGPTAEAFGPHSSGSTALSAWRRTPDELVRIARDAEFADSLSRSWPSCPAPPSSQAS
jgi:hypothetical protein